MFGNSLRERVSKLEIVVADMNKSIRELAELGMRGLERQESLLLDNARLEAIQREATAFQR